MPGFDPEFLARYSKARYDAIMAASIEAHQNDYRAPGKDDKDTRRVSAHTATTGLSADTATGVQPVKN